MLTYSSNLKAILDTASTKLDWAAKVQNALGNTRRLRCFRDANAAAVDPVATGTEFLNIGSSGALTIVAGNIVDFGTLTNATIKQPADLTTGACVLRLEGNGYWLQGTLGVTGSGKDYVFTANFNTDVSSVGVAMVKGSGVKAPTLLDSGTGPLSPAPTTNKPFDILIEDWSSGSAVTAGVIPFDVTLPNMVFDDTEMQASMGDIKAYRSSTTVVLGNMEFGAVMAGIHKGVNALDATEPVYEVLVLRKPTNANWPNYPAYSGWSTVTSDTFGDKPFKVKIRRADGSVLYTFQMRDGLPINHPSLNQDVSQVATKPMRPLFHCAGALMWRSHRTKQHTYAKKYYPGMADTRPLRPSTTHDNAASNADWRLANLSQANGMLNWRILPKWPMAINNTTLAADWPTKDAYLGETANGANAYARYTGWGWEPGSVSAHDQLCVKGGVRFDRAVMPAWYAIYMHDSTWVRPRDNDSIVDMKEAAELGYYNLPTFFVTDVKTAASVPVAEVFANRWSHSLGWYAPNAYYPDDGSATRSIPFFATGSNAKDLDKLGRLPWSGAAPDFLHNYWSPAWSVIFDNSAVGVIANKYRLLSSIMLQANDVSDTKNPIGWFLTRMHAWRWQHMVTSWKMSTDHEWGINRAIQEKRWENELNAIYTYIVKPALADNSQAKTIVALRNLGNPVNGDNDPTQSTTSMTFYMAHVFQLMKAFGLWDVLRNKSITCKAALDFMVRCMDLMSIDFILDTPGYGLYVENNYDTLAKADGTIATSWADWAANVRPRQAQEDWIHDLNGNPTGPHYSTETLRYQYVCMRRDWITEADVPCARTNGINLAIAKYEAYMQIKDAVVAAQTTPYYKMANDFQNYYPMFAPIKPYTP